MSKYTGLEIAIIGLSGKFPGSENIQQFWENLRDGKEAVEFFTEEELLESGEDMDVISQSNYVKANAYMKNKEYFDSAFFGYRPDEAKIMDPQTRLFHECVWSALEDAGCDLNHPKSKIGLFAGSSGNINWQVYSEFLNQGGLVDDFSATHLSSPRFMSTRVSYCLNLKGPAVYLDTACSTSLVAIHEACRSLLVGDCNIAVAGGVSVTNKFKKGYLYQEGMIYSKDGHCRTFDEEASGTIGSEGAGVVVLKTLKNAIRDKDNIWAIIKGSGINNDGSQKVGYAAPSIDGQTEAIIRAQKWSKIEPESVSLIEAHGTATELGDPIEIEALNRAFGKSDKPYCAIGSVKSNFGHLDAAAGVAGLIKAALSIRYRQLPPTLNYNAPNPKINLTDSPFFINDTLKKWENDKYPLRAGVSSFGIGGTNAHIILEEAPEREASLSSRNALMFCFSGKTPSALQSNITKFADYLEQDPEPNMTDIAYTLQAGRQHFAYRKAYVASTKAELLVKIKQDNVPPSVVEGKKASIVFMFSGQGSQYTDMCQGLYNTEEVFTSEVNKCLDIIKSRCNKDLRPILLQGNQGNLLGNTEYTQPSLFIIEYALAKQLMEWGINPSQMIGHSIGEYVAACLCGVFTLEDAIYLVVKRGELMQRVEPGEMLSVSAPKSKVQEYLSQHPEVSLAAVNSSELCVVAGSSKAINKFETSLSKSETNVRRLKTSHAFHSAMMDSIIDDFKNEFRSIQALEPQHSFISNLTSRPVDNEEIVKAEYWADHLRNTVRFETGIDYLINTKKSNVFIEVGPGKALTTFVKTNISREHHHTVEHTVRHPRENEDDLNVLITTVSRLWCAGVEIDSDKFYAGEKRYKVSLPTYAFDRYKYPVDVDAQQLILNLIKNGNGELKMPELDTTDEFVEAVVTNQDEMSVTEQKVTNLWKQFFGKNDITIHNDFFDIGGDSLKALTMIGRLKQKLDIEVVLTDFFNHTTVKALAMFIDNIADKQNTEVPINKSANKPYYKLSSAQKRLYFLHEFDKASLAYNLPQFFTIIGDFDVAKLETVFAALINRHEVLRTSFRLEVGNPVQRVNNIKLLDVEHYHSESNEVNQIIDQFVRPFNLTQAPLIRVGLLKIDKVNHILMVDMHHIVADGVSYGILIEEFLALYTEQELPEISLQYRDYAEWQQSDDQQDSISSQKKFWIDQFEDELVTLELPLDFVRPVVKQFDADVIDFEIDKSQTKKLRQLAKDTNTTPYMVLLTLFNILLSRLGNQEDIVVGTPTSGRTSHELENMVGMFVNTLPLRNRVNGKLNFIEVLNGVKNTTVRSFENQHYPYEELIDELTIKRDTSHNPLFDVLFSYRTAHEESSQVPGLTLRAYNRESVITQFDLTLFTVEEQDVFKCSFEYCTTLFKNDSIQRFISYFRKIVIDVLAEPEVSVGNLEIITDIEKRQVQEIFNATSKPIDMAEPLHVMFEQLALKHPDKTIVGFNDITLSYRQLNERSNQLGRRMQQTGISKGDIIGIFLPRTPEVIVSMLATLKLGCAYVPIDPEYPLDRVKHILNDSGLKIILSNEELGEEVRNQVPQVQNINVYDEDMSRENNTNLYIEVKTSDLAYMIYTSGSTGKPKGVMIEHGNVVNFVKGITDRINMRTAAKMLCLTTISFDIVVLETILPLLNGIKIELTDTVTQKDPKLLSAYIKSREIDFMQITPSHLNILLSAEGNYSVLDSVEVLMVGGEAFPQELLNKLKENYQGRIYNMYGPTETTVWSTVADLTVSDRVNIGTPINNTTIRIYDQYGNTQPVGLAGELYIGGYGVSRGYWNRPDLTTEKFTLDREQGERLYRTGDIARWTKDGRLECLDRVDNQVKIRGFRIELGEIETQLLTIPNITSAVVYAKKKDGDKYLVAYYVGTEYAVRALRDKLAAMLPEYMIPSYFVQLDALPLTPNCKIDRRALPEPSINIESAHVPPSNEVESSLVEIWTRVLKLQPEELGIKTNFFEIGGNSLKATALMAEIHKVLDIQIPLKELFNKQDVESMADYIITVKQISVNTHHNEEITEISI